ncbi:peptide chain release factor N(5)-glutamine methyltransferase [Candidatus Parcubacteria bacterium]|nr:peptide chain release factor N(5)-glutamine methyltransferase [Candidatus Parcubacteria bacterium]
MEKEINWLLQEKYQGRTGPEFDADVERLKRGEPLAYVIGFTDFLGCKINLSKKTLIPRVETEHWVEEAINGLKVKDQGLRILDIFAGSGCIGVAVLKKLPEAEVVFSDLQQNAIEQIEINTKLNNLPESRYQIIQSDVFENISGKFDVIFANPPYIPTGDKKNIQPSVSDYEPKEALFGGDDGLLYIEKFLARVRDFLHEKGVIYMEFDPPQEEKIAGLAEKYGYGRVEFRKDQYGRPRCAVIYSPGR